MRHDLDLRQRGRLAVLNSRNISCPVVDLHPGVTRRTAWPRWSEATPGLLPRTNKAESIPTRLRQLHRAFQSSSVMIGSPLRMIPPISSRQLAQERFSISV